MLAVSAKLKYQTKIAQNHKQKSAWVNIDLSRLYTQSTYNPGRQVGPVRLQQVPGAAVVYEGVDRGEQNGV